ncbi:hypothetical protein KNU91_gp015 [Enterococcus phage nattely]|uniref:Uncharacterized protein n=1 Tax=Enterococcus phage nattely TaxID=2719593 RepID=A0A6G9LNT5_9CAUD|nr:hypothetical protein KNU91_gp015 [Enterococcus phage nattely]QIQ66182.1 hypothetical protein nattely_15 [Enterococcus phage nattely]
MKNWYEENDILMSIENSQKYIVAKAPDDDNKFYKLIPFNSRSDLSNKEIMRSQLKIIVLPRVVHGEMIMIGKNDDYCRIIPDPLKVINENGKFIQLSVDREVHGKIEIKIGKERIHLDEKELNDLIDEIEEIKKYL